ncbi:hypothetical protein [Mobilicoccus pelagius]|uniref:Uncharacterized protein n=1 Tax=Mobilicoccus pelagius NBRC 104925 TaxID=1089455 RepID=H5UUE6_9MICO|nr:hypothetical protein [Mobilicoccus pelagius]GAB49354.1 hypothetical protein MOPEL_113_00340 [Mobilicoccus pelagius NBRC 104925]
MNVTTPVTIRVATDSDDDRLASARLSSEAFGYSTPRRAADVDPLNGSRRTMYPCRNHDRGCVVTGSDGVGRPLTGTRPTGW